MKETAYFLPYQIAWLNDHSRRKIWEKSRRIGATYVQSYEDVRDCIQTPGLPVWFSSADESAAKEYILYCEQWAKIFKAAGKILSSKEEVLDEKNGVKALIIRFVNGSRIHGLSSNPTAFRSKGGKTNLDEFDWHSDQTKMYAAAKPCVTWGYDMRILSTYQSSVSLYAQFVKDAKKAVADGKVPTFSLHTVTIYDAVEQGLLDRIMGHKTTIEEREAWLAEEKAACGDENIWLQEYCCIPVSENDAFLTWDMIRPCEDSGAGKPELAGTGAFYVGNDIGRRNDLAVFWVIEKVGDVFWTREVLKLKGASFAAQDDELARLVDAYKPIRICMDQTGMGEKPVEDAKKRHGNYRVEGVIFTGPSKQELAFELRRRFEDRQVRIPVDQDIRRAHHAVKKTVTAAGNIRFDADRTEKGHADEFWAHALALHGASNPAGPIEFESTGKKRTCRSSSMTNFIGS
jgi:phage FluMu gp28-like protein